MAELGSGGLERALGTVTFNLTVQQNVFFLQPQGQQGNGSVDHPISKQYTTCGHQHPSNAQFTVPQETYPNMHQPDTVLNPYQRPATHYETHWRTDIGAMNANYNLARDSYAGAAAGVPMAREAASVDRYEQTRLAESARQSQAYAAK